MNKQLIAFERNRVYISLTTPAEPSEERKLLLEGLTEELKDVNVFLPQEAILFLSEEDMKEIHSSVLPKLAEKYYPQGKWSPLYPGFPDQVLQKTEKELMDDRDYIYDTGNYQEFLERNSWYSDTEKQIIDKSGGVVLKPMREADLLDIFRSIVSSGNSISQNTKEELIYLLEKYPEYKLPDEIPFKETLCLVMTWREDYLPKTINDVLRYGMFVAGADPALIHIPSEISEGWGRKTKNPKSRKIKLSRPQRREILERLERLLTTQSLEKVIPDAKRFYGHWVLLSEFLHPGDYKEKYPKTISFFSALKSKDLVKTFKTWESILQDKYNRGENIMKIAKFVSARPGELVRRFDSLLRRAKKTGQESDLLDIFLDTEGMKNKTLLELLAYYDKRNSGATRMISIKGSSKMKSLQPLAPLPGIMVETVRDCVERKILLNIDHSVKEVDLSGKVVYLDPKLKDIPIPKGMRNATTVFPSGIKFDIPEDKNFIRLFVHWIQEGGRNEDLDLHAALFGDNKVMNIGFNTGLRKDDYIMHSGDVLNRPGDCSEFVDIDIEKAKKAGWEYVMMDVHNYKGRPMNSLDCWLGYVLNESRVPVSQTWAPSNPDCSQKITSDQTSIVAWIFDLKNRKAILINAGMYGIPINNLCMNKEILNFYVTENNFNTWNVLQRHYQARGAEIVDEPGEGVHIEVKFEDIMKDYTKVLEIIG